MDPLSDVLSLLKLRSYVSGGFDVGGEWSVQFPEHDGIKCYAVVSGQCWLSVEGVPDVLRPQDRGLLPVAERAAFPPCQRHGFDTDRRPHALFDRAGPAASCPIMAAGIASLPAGISP